MEEKTVIQIVQAITSSLSVIGCAIMSYRLSKDKSVNIANKMLSYLFFIDFVLALVYGVGVSGTYDRDFCQFQGLIVQWFGIASISWNVLMAYHMSSWIVRRKHPKRIEKTVKEYIVIIFTLSGVLALILLGINSYSDSYIWCWIDSEKKYLRIFCFDIILLMSWIVVIVSLFQVNRSVQNRKRNNNLLMNRLNKLLDNDRIIQKKLMLYVSIFIFTWFFMILNRLYETAAERTSFTLSLLEVIFLPLQGFWNSLIYGELLAKNYYYNLLVDYLKKWNNNVNNLIHNTNYPVIDNNKLIYVDNSVELKEVLVEIPESKSEYSNSIISTLKYRPKYYSIFCTTLNMGEAPADSITAALENWILPGHEIYCIGLQECMELQSVRSLILQRLGGADSYHMFTSEIGSDNTRLGYHGYIALTIFVRMECIRAGEVYQTKASSERSATGTNLLITTAENKGAVGIPLQIHDTSIVFLTAHLPSDSKGISKLSKRNASAHRILKDLSLAEEDIGFDVHFQHDHIMLMGDLNYRMRNEVGGGVSALTGVAVASLIEKHTLNDDRNWLARKYNMLQYKYPNLPENRHEMQLIKAAKSSSKGAWTSVLRLDELRSIMIDGDAFCNFGEPMPCFPPSYKRKIGAEADCGDYTDPFQVIRGYTNTGEIEEELAFLQTTVNSNNPIRSLTLGKDALEYLARESAIALADDEIDVTVVESSNLDKIFGSVDDFDEKTNEKSTKVGIDDGLVREDFGEVNPMQVTKKSSVLEKSVPSILRTASSDSPKSPGKSLMFADVDSRKNSIAAGEERGSRGVSFAQDSIDSFEQEDIRESSVEETGSSDDARDRSSGSGDNSKSKKRRKAAISPHNSESPDNSQKPSLITKILPKAIDAKKLRRPSYTDRILIHSLPDREERLKVQAYDSCDLMRISDHRPVSMTTVLMVNESVSYPESPHTSESGVQGKQESKTKEPSFVVYELTITNLVANFGNTVDIADSDSDSDSDSQEDRDDNGEDSMIERPSTTDIDEDEVGDSIASLPAANKMSPKIARKNSLVLLNPMHYLRRGSETRSSATSGPISTEIEVEMRSSERRRSKAGRNKSININSNRGIALSEGEKLDWGDEFDDAGEWKRKVLEEQQQKDLDAMKQNVIKQKLRTKMKKKKKSADKSIHEVQIVFPLPSKDPLLSHRKIFDFSRAYHLEDDDDYRKKSIRLTETTNRTSSHTLESSSFKHPGHSLERSNNLLRSGNEQQKGYYYSLNDLLNPICSFLYKPGISLRADSSEKRKSRRDISYKVVGCASPELGAHVLLKFTNKVGYDLGSTVISLSHLIHHRVNEVHYTEYHNISLSSGAQLKGELSGKFTLRYLESPLFEKKSNH